MNKITVTFKKERSCKHSVRYAPVDDSAKDVTSIIYIKKITLEQLGNPEFIEVSLEVKDV